MSQAEKIEYASILHRLNILNLIIKMSFIILSRTQLRRGTDPIPRFSNVHNCLFFDPVTVILTTLSRIAPEGVALRIIPLYYFMV